MASPGLRLAPGEANGSAVYQSLGTGQLPSPDSSTKLLEDASSKEETADHPVDQDSYGASLFSIVADLAELFGSEAQRTRPLWFHLVRLVFVHMVLLANYGMQFGMLYFIKNFVVDAAKAEIANNKKHGELQETVLDVLITSHPGFLAVILTLWTLTILIEFRKVETFITAVNSLRSTDAMSQMMHHETDEDGKEMVRIKGMTTPVFWVIMLFITLPKILIVSGLFYLGFEWLASTTSAADVILNALALGFVVNIDEQLFHALIPQSLKEKMEAAHLSTAKPIFTSEAQELQQSIKNEWHSFYRSIFYMICPVIVSYGYILYQQRLIASENDDA
eukprot:TRINITY_DN103498_c0_g1_i1.p1 TRINITY_DN103498_c0_g1~~TRINITY_DN103498_c0_g1_i1.p1  ORF type:complete len:334 (+),score=78.23 TRINITY_DN103498_c0_g1_i1:87-1088(+)